MIEDCYSVSNKIFKTFWDNFQNNQFVLKTFHQDTFNIRIDGELELVKRPILIQTAFCGYFEDVETEEEEDDNE